MTFPWSGNDPPEIASDLATSSYTSLPQMLVAAADRFDSALALAATAVTLVYRWSYNRAQSKIPELL